MNKINNRLLDNIKEELEINKNISQNEVALKYKVSERTIRRYYKLLKSCNVIAKKGNGKKTIWIIKR